MLPRRGIEQVIRHLDLGGDLRAADAREPHVRARRERVGGVLRDRDVGRHRGRQAHVRREQLVNVDPSGGLGRRDLQIGVELAGDGSRDLRELRRRTEIDALHRDAGVADRGARELAPRADVFERGASMSIAMFAVPTRVAVAGSYRRVAVGPRVSLPSAVIGFGLRGAVTAGGVDVEPRGDRRGAAPAATPFDGDFRVDRAVLFGTTLSIRKCVVSSDAVRSPASRSASRSPRSGAPRSPTWRSRSSEGGPSRVAGVPGPVAAVRRGWWRSGSTTVVVPSATTASASIGANFGFDRTATPILRSVRLAASIVSSPS